MLLLTALAFMSLLYLVYGGEDVVIPDVGCWLGAAVLTLVLSVLLVYSCDTVPGVLRHLMLICILSLEITVLAVGLAVFGRSLARG